MNLLMLIQRFLATLIDLIIVYLPFLLLVHVIFTGKEFSSIANLLAGILFVLYNMISESSFSGKTIGKFFAKLRVKTVSTDLMEIGQREFAKLLYFLPVAGWIFIVVSVVMYFTSGRFLHDKIGRSEVIVGV
ncbi:RDD family protein [Lactococcus allomyrinae]|uniref:RDD family protein n=1 Tax=Lactococcus allomyrinae TaxID=2419773 RepID=A0A387BD68_9LACT|nr:RDD family protein [Lactococcus allomyrinae]AYG01855.1 RDD family protein [Lactococcus allomyrinae]